MESTVTAGLYRHRFIPPLTPNRLSFYIRIRSTTINPVAVTLAQLELQACFEIIQGNILTFYAKLLPFSEIVLVLSVSYYFNMPVNNFKRDNIIFYTVIHG